MPDKKTESTNKAGPERSARGRGRRGGRPSGSGSQKKPAGSRRKPSGRRQIPSIRDFSPISPDVLARLRGSLGDATYIVFDIESTGGNPERNGITEISALRYVNGKVVDKFYSLVNPQCRIPPIVRKMTGITKAMVQDAPIIDDIMPGFIEFIASDFLVSHNTIGDLKFLVYFAKKTCDHKLENFFLCTHLLTEKLIKEAPDKSLKGLSKHFEFPMGKVHRADADAELTLCLFKEICVRLDKAGRENVIDAIRLQGDLESSMRLGWAIDPGRLQDIPTGAGVLSLYGKDEDELFLTSCIHLNREVEKFQDYEQMPRQLLKLALQAYDLEYHRFPNLFAAMLGEGRELAEHNLSYLPSQWHQRHAQVVFIRALANGKYCIGVGSPPQGALHVFGMVADRKAAIRWLKDIAEIVESKCKNAEVEFAADLLPGMTSLLYKNTDAVISDQKKSRFSLRFLLSGAYRKNVAGVIDALEKLKALELPGRWRSLLDEHGFVIGPSTNRDHVLLYPVVHSVPAEPREVPSKWISWLSNEDEGKVVRGVVEAGPGSERTLAPLGHGDACAVNAVLWLKYVNKGRGNRCHYFDVEGLDLEPCEKP